MFFITSTVVGTFRASIDGIGYYNSSAAVLFCLVCV